MVTVETGGWDGRVVVLVTADDSGTCTQIVMDPDEAREFSNNIGAAILAASASRTGAMT